MRTKLLLSLVLTVAIIIRQFLLPPTAPTSLTTLIAIPIGVLLSTFFLDLEFLLQAYIYEPATSFAENVRQLVAQRNLTGLAAYVNTHQDDLSKPILRSSLFQVVLALLCAYLVFSRVTLLGTSFALGILLQSLYLGWQRRHRDWFWEIKSTLPPIAIDAYFAVIAMILLYLLII